MQALPSYKMTVDEFLPWAEAQERGRYELHDGEVIAMSPERAGHWKAKAGAFIALRLLTAGEFRLNPPGLSMTVTSFFE